MTWNVRSLLNFSGPMETAFVRGELLNNSGGLTLLSESWNVSILRLPAFRKLTGLVSLHTLLLTRLRSRQANPCRLIAGRTFVVKESRVFSVDALDKHGWMEVLSGWRFLLSL